MIHLLLNDFDQKTLKEFRPLYLRAKNELKALRYNAIDVITPTNRKSIQSGWLIPLVDNSEFNGIICTVEDITGEKLVRSKLKVG